jgi:hypothetical protein
MYNHNPLPTYKIKPENELLRQVLGEYRRLKIEQHLSARFERNRVRIEIANSLKRDGVIKRSDTLSRQRLARELTARMTSVAESMLGL